MFLTMMAFQVVSAPLKMMTNICESIRDMAEHELYGEEKIKQELMEAQIRLELDEITEDEYLVVETTLMERLEEGRRRRGEGG